MITFVQGRNDILGDAISRIPQPQPAMSNIHLNIPTSKNNFAVKYKTDQFFHPIIKALEGTFPENDIGVGKVKFMLPSFRLGDGFLFLKNLFVSLVIVLRNYYNLHMMHD